MMKTYELVVPCHFGLEAETKKEIIELGYEITKVTDGRVSFTGDADAIARANVFIRTGERVLVKVGSFKAFSFDGLFQETRKLPWEEFIPADGSFWVTKASSIKSKLFATSSIQSIMKKAMVNRMSEHYHMEKFPENGAKYPVRVFVYKDEVSVCLDSSGDSLHKRGYRLKMGKAPITETLAAALLRLTGFDGTKPLADPMCGSGTFLIEAAMMAANVAPGMDRAFAAESWKNLVDRRYWYNAIEEANDIADHAMLEGTAASVPDIRGYDIDPDIIRVAGENARRAGVEKILRLEERDIGKFQHEKSRGILICNPPYGERIEDKRNLPMLYTELKEAYEGLDGWDMHIISAWEDAEKYLGKSAKNRKVYNGMMKAYFYSYFGNPVEEAPVGGEAADSTADPQGEATSDASDSSSEGGSGAVSVDAG